MSNSKKKILIMMSGSIAAYKVCSLISLLVKNNYHVKVAASPSALKFVGAATIEGLTGEKVYSDLFESGAAMEHINLERWADLILAAPATSHFINRCASGIGDDLLSTLFLAHQFKKPFLVAPAMNTAMYLNPVTQKSIETLKSYGLHILESASGVLACGETGYGRLLEPDQLFAEIQKLHPTTNPTKIQATKVPKVLVTAGGTREAVDDVRFLTNSSTGITGEKIASALASLGFDVTLDLAQSSQVSPEPFYKLEKFDNYSSLESLLKKQLQETDFDFVFHAAAVSDFSIAKSEGKISSDSDLQITLKRNPKIINSIKSWSKNKNVKLIGFKLTSQSDENQILNKIEKLQKESAADFVVHNDVATLKDRGSHQFNVFVQKENFTLSGVDSLVAYFSEKIGANL